MSVHSTPQASVEAQLKVLDQIDNTDVHALIESTLSDWNGREVSTGEISAAISKISSLVQEKMESVKSGQELEIKAALASLNATDAQIQRIGSAASSSLGTGEAKTVETIIGQINGDALDEHPAYRKDWSFSIAESVLELPSMPAGSYVLIGSKDYLSLLIKLKDNSVESHQLEENDGVEGGYWINIPEAYHSCGGGGSCSGYESCSGLSDFSEPLQMKEDTSPPEPPAVLQNVATPAPAVKPTVVTLLKLKDQFRGINFSRWGSDWSTLAAQTKEKTAPGHRPQLIDPALNKKSAVDVINLPESTQKKIERDEKPVFFHCNTVKSGAHSFDCHQLPTDQSRDDIWLSLWNDAGQGGGKATIMKLSTAGCPSRNDLPTIRDYWPKRTGSTSTANFIKRCERAESKLALEAEAKGPKTKGYLGSIKRRVKAIAAAQKEFDTLEKEIAALRQPEEGAASSAVQVDTKSLIAEKQSRADELTKRIAMLKAEHAELSEQLATFQQAAKEHLAHVTEQKIQAQSGGTGDFEGKLTTIDDITVELTEENELEGFPGAIVRRFKLTKAGEEEPRTVTQIDYPNWADFSASSSGTLASLRDVYQKEHGDNPTPMKVHCRAGVGRTGTFVAFSGAMDIIENAVAEGRISDLDGKKMLFDLLVENRAQRDFQMVQQSEQAEQLVTALQEEVLKLAQQEALKA